MPATVGFLLGSVICKWEFGQVAGPNWRFGQVLPRWQIGGLNMAQVSVLSTGYVQVPVRAVAAGQVVDPTGDTVQMAFTAVSSNPVGGDWKTASWDTTPVSGQYVAQCLVGPTGTVVLPVGSYAVWVKITATPETIVEQIAGGLQVV